jgi:hypothetical protein
VDNLYVFDPKIIDEAKVLEDALGRANKGRPTMVHYHKHGQECNERCFVPTASESRR